MAVPFKSGQRGLSFIGLVFVAVVLAGSAAVVAQAVPTYIEFLAVSKAAKKASEGTTVGEVRTIFDKAASIDNISSITGKDLDVTKVNEKVVVSFAYQREIHLGGPAYLTLKYDGKSR
ncbi:MAG: DUF4845 domain-containing protein [Comamonadaceae bacterium]|nr:DUF4845 domain-containing protein [Comamonadaceae bacterium]